MTNFRNITKRTLSVLLCMVMVITVFMSVPFTASAETVAEQAEIETNAEKTAEETATAEIEQDPTLQVSKDKTDIASVGISYDIEYDGVRYSEYAKGKLEIVGYNPDTIKEDVVIPSTIDGKTVISIDGRLEYSPFQKSKIKSIVLPSTLTSLSSRCLASCYELESVTILGAVKNINAEAFYCDIKLTEVNLPDSVETIGDNAFDGCLSLKSIEFPKNLKEVEADAFTGCESLEKVTINAALESIGTAAFKGLESLSEVVFEGGNTKLKIGHSAFASCKNLKSMDFSHIKTISASAFAYTGLESVNFGKIAGSSLGESAFYRCHSLESVTLSEGVKKIPKYCFSECENLKTVSMSGVTSVGAEAFYECSSVDKIDFSNISNVEERAFYECTSLTNVAFSKSVECNIKGAAFYGCTSLKTVKLSHKTTSINNKTFEGCTALESIEAKNITEIGNYAFSSCENLKNISFATNNRIEYVDEGAFYNCYYLTEFDLTYVRQIGSAAFENCYSLSKVKIGEYLREVDERAFFNCYSLYDIYLPKCIEYVGEMAFGCCEENGQYYTFSEFTLFGVPDSLADEYASAYGFTWSIPAPVLSSISNTSDGVKISFKHITDLSGGKYRVYRKSGSTSWTKLADVTGTTYTDKTAKSGTKYTYTVKHIGEPKNSAYDKAGLTTVYLKTPKVSKITNTNSGVELTWGKITGAKKYNVYTKSGSGWKKIGESTSTTFTHKSAKSGTSYTYTVRAYDSSEEYKSAYVSAGYTKTFVAPPTLKSVSNTTSGVKITWNKSAGATKYRVFVKSGSKWKKLGDTSSTSFTHKSAKSGTKYTYTVRCLSSTGKSYVSGYDKKGISYMYLSAPKVSKISNAVNGAKITWGKVAGATKYNVYVKASSGWKKIDETIKTSYTHTAAKSGKNYTYTVRAYDSSGAYKSAYVSAGYKNKFIATPVITSLSSTKKGVKISWGAVEGVANYRVLVKTDSGWKKVGDTTSTSLVDKSAKSGKSYTYIVRCLSSTGKSYLSGYDKKGTTITYKK